MVGQLGQGGDRAEADSHGHGAQLVEAITLLAHLDQVLLAGQSIPVADDAQDGQRRASTKVDGRVVARLGQDDVGQIDDGFDGAELRTDAPPSGIAPTIPGMATLVPSPTRVEAAGNLPKLIEEYVGRVTTGHKGVSVARMRSPGGWVEPGQAPEFDEVTVVLSGHLRVTSADGDLDVGAGQAVIVNAGEWVRYSTPDPQGAEYIAVCLPAFSPHLVHRDDD